MEELRKTKENLSEELLSSRSSVIEMQGKLSAVKDNFIGPFTFDAVKQLLTKDRPDHSVLNKLKKELEDKEGSESEIELVKKIEELNYTPLEMLMHIKPQLATTGFGTGNVNEEGHRYFNHFYLSKWIELSLVEVQKPVNTKRKKNVLSANGRKFVSMVEIEKLSEK